MKRTAMAGLTVFVLAAAAWPSPQEGTHAHYLVLTAKTHTPPPFAAVDILCGPEQLIDGQKYKWWQLEIRAATDDETTPLLRLRALTSNDPFQQAGRKIEFKRYMIQIPETGETLEYRDVHTKSALLPPWRDFELYFVPHRAKSSRLRQGVPETCTYLGHVLTLRHVGHNVPWTEWENITVLELDRELLVGTGRNFKDKEGHRLPQKPKRQDYTYVKFTADDYRTMIDAGINMFIVSPEQQKWIISKPVFYLRAPGGTPPLRYPADLYRSNYLGCVMFMDEPSIIMVGDKNIHNILRYFSDAATLIRMRVHSRYYSRERYGAFLLEKALLDRGVNLGDMRLMQYDYPSWETMFETAYYQLQGGLNGIVHEGRYRLEEFDRAVSRWLDRERRHTAEEMLRYHFAFLRGAARAFGKHWGTSIYGQCDPAIAPKAVTLAYDMGARYVWFWTSDHDHHLPWPEQLKLARLLKKHAAKNPRPSIFGPPPLLDTAIVIPNGYFLSLRNLWWVRVLNKEGKNEASRRYKRLMKRAMKAIHEAMDRGEEFDILVDDGREMRNYRKIVQITDRE